MAIPSSHPHPGSSARVIFPVRPVNHAFKSRRRLLLHSKDAQFKRTKNVIMDLVSYSPHCCTYSLSLAPSYAVVGESLLHAHSGKGVPCPSPCYPHAARFMRNIGSLLLGGCERELVPLDSYQLRFSPQGCTRVCAMLLCKLFTADIISLIVSQSWTLGGIKHTGEGATSGIGVSASASRQFSTSAECGTSSRSPQKA